MSSFLKPESALQRAEDFLDVGKKQDALDTLHNAMQHKRFKSNWSPTIEKIMIKHLELCVELKKMRTAREGLYTYRGMCQAANIQSLETVVQRFRKSAEDKVAQAKAVQDVGAEMDDLEEMEAPQAILLRAIQAHDTRQQSQDKDIHIHFRFLWETYKVVLDVLKSNVRLEEVYHETAKNAFEFCRSNQRPQEFKRLSDTLRKNWQDLQKHTGKVPNYQVDPKNIDTINRNLETRCKQLQICTELDLWRESYITATEMHELMGKTRPKPSLRSMYYEYLGQIFWKSDNHLFHAFSCLKNLQFVKAAKANISKEELQLLASKAVLATLCVPYQKHSDIHESLELTTEGASSPYEKAKKHAQLFNAASVPTREAISQSLVEKSLLPLAAGPCRKLFELLETDFTPLSLCQDAKPFLEELAVGDLFDGKLVDYLTPLKQTIFFRLMKQLSEVYSNMTIENFEKAASIVPFSTAEKWMANAARQHGINIQINYSHKAIIFGAPRKVDMKSMRQPLIEIGRKLQQAMQRVAPEEQHKKERQEKAQLQQTIVQRIEEETKLIRLRKDEIERRKEASEKRKGEEERKMMLAQRRQEELEASQEKERQEKERIQRQKDREMAKKREQEEQRTHQLVEEMKKQARDNPFLKKKLEQLSNMDTATKAESKVDIIKKTHEEQLQRERTEKIRQRKLEAKRIDHLARALREHEVQLLKTWAKEVEQQDEEFINKLGELEVQEKRKEHEENLKERDFFRKYLPAQKEFISGPMNERRDEYERAVNERWDRCMNKAIDAKIERARKRCSDAARQRREERERRRKEEEERLEREEREAEEERRRLQEEEEAELLRQEEEEKARIREEKKKEREAQQEKMRQQAEVQRKKEQEIEERQRQEAAERAKARAEAMAAKAEERQAAPAAEEGGWRSAPARRGPPGRDEPRRDEPPRRGGGDDDWRSGPRNFGGLRDRDEGGARDEAPKKEAWRPRVARGDGDNWRSGGNDDRRDDRPSRFSDDRDDRRGGGSSINDRMRARDEEPPRRNTDRESWRRRGEENQEEGGWRNRESNRDSNRDSNRGGGGGDSWRRPDTRDSKPKEEEKEEDWSTARGAPRSMGRDSKDEGSAWGARRAPAAERPSAWGNRDKQEEAPARSEPAPAPKKEAPPPAAPQPSREEPPASGGGGGDEEDGWEMAPGKKKKGRK